MKFMKKHKGIVILSIVLLVVIGAIGVCLFSMTSLGPYEKVIIEQCVDNSLRNEQVNVWNYLVASEDKLYFNANNKFPKSGIYEISSKSKRNIYRDYFDLYPELPSLKCSYKGMLFDDCYPDEYVDDKGVRLEYFDPKTRGFTSSIYLKAPEDEKERSFFTTGEELYYETEKEGNLYRYVENDYELVASDELCGDNYVPLDYYKNYMYYAFPKTVDDYYGFINIDKIYKYNLITKKVEMEIDTDFLNEILVQDNVYFSGNIMVLDNQIYLSFVRHDDVSDHYDLEKEDDEMLNDMEFIEVDLIYRYDVKSKRFDKMFETTEAYVLNGYGNNAYIGLRTSVDKKGLYIMKPKSDKPEKIYSGNYDVDSVYIVDEKWVYFGDALNNLHRVSSDGKIIEKVF